MTWHSALLVATGLHLGFQLTVSLVVYPALVRTPADRWPTVHTAHGRRITPVVGIAYAGGAVSSSGVLLTDPSYGAVVAAAGTGIAIALTATLAAPLHGRLAPGPEERLLVRLQRVDWLRTAAALVAVLGALLAAA